MCFLGMNYIKIIPKLKCNFCTIQCIAHCNTSMGKAHFSDARNEKFLPKQSNADMCMWHFGRVYLFGDESIVTSIHTLLTAMEENGKLRLLEVAQL